VTEWKLDGFGRLALEKRPDGTETVVTLARTKDEAWRVTRRTKTGGAADDTVEFDSLGRPVRWFWHGPSPKSSTGMPPRLMQEVAYDTRSGHIAWSSVPVSEGTDASKMLFDEHEFDAVGREVRHTTPWKALVQTAYDGLLVKVTDPIGHVTITELDPLGRPAAITDAAKGVTSYVYGPFGFLHSVTDPGTLADPSGAVTITTRDALGRVKQLDDPDRGTTIQVWNGWGELLSSTDAIGRVSTFEYDGLGRMESRTDKQNGVLGMTTTWTWDTAANGLGKLHKLTTPDGEKVFAYNARGQLERLTLAVSGADAVLEGKLAYDPFGRVATITYPTPAGAPLFVITQEHDPFGNVVRVHDGATDYWRLTDVDNAGRYREDVLGNDVLTERSYYPDKQRLKSIVTQGPTMVQSLTYDYDARLSLKSRTDALQPQNKTERFRYDALDRLTCAYFSANEDPFAPCATSYAYEPNGNMTFKSDVGVLSYNNAAHPHAVTSAGGESFAYDAVGNQFSRPGGVTVTYTPFDLPKTLKQGALTLATFGYDGEQRRIRKTTPDKETLYFGDLYERVTAKKGPAMTDHRYFIHSPERVVAVVTRGGTKPGTLYMHADNLGSVDVLTNESGGVEERRSYDPFGQRRNPVWGQPPPASFASKTTLGFTGHEHDDELGLVNMRGRVFDPKVGRFLTTDPIVADLFSGQSLNAYSYVMNNPLAFVDPTGFEPEKPPILPIREGESRNASGEIFLHWTYPPRMPRPAGEHGQEDAAEFGAAAPAADVDTTGSSPEHDPQAATTAPEDWSQNPYVQIEGGFVAGLLLGFVPFGGVGQQLLDAGEVLPHGTPQSRFGLAVGQIVGGVVTLAGGITGGVLGGVTSATGIGAAVGVPAIVVSTTLVVGGAGNIAAGIRGLMTTGSGSSGPQGTAPTFKWGNPTSRPTYGHTFSDHTAKLRPEQLTERARGLGHQVGQWSNDKAAADFIANVAKKGPGVHNVQLPSGMGRSFLADGTELTTDMARVIVKPDGSVRTAFPFSSAHPN
jgi:RHS repeat-associated protein